MIKAGDQTETLIQEKTSDETQSGWLDLPLLLLSCLPQPACFPLTPGVLPTSLHRPHTSFQLSSSFDIESLHPRAFPGPFSVTSPLYPLGSGLGASQPSTLPLG